MQRIHSDAMHFFLEMMKKTLPEGWLPASEAESKALSAELQKELAQASPLCPSGISPKFRPRQHPAGQERGI